MTRPVDALPKPAGWAHTVAQAIFLGRCAKCGSRHEDLFRDNESFRENRLSGMCQACQDAFFVEQDYPRSAWDPEYEPQGGA